MHNSYRFRFRGGGPGQTSNSTVEACKARDFYKQRKNTVYSGSSLFLSSAVMATPPAPGGGR